MKNHFKTFFPLSLTVIFLSLLVVLQVNLGQKKTIIKKAQEKEEISNAKDNLINEALSKQAEQIVVQITVKEKSGIQFLVDSGFDIWQVKKDQNQFSVIALIDQKQRQWLQENGYLLKVDETKTQKLKQIPQQVKLKGVKGLGFFGGYRTVEETYSYLHQMENQYPNLIQVIDIGDSWKKTVGQGGYDILAVKVTNQQTAHYAKPKFFILAETHARELTTSEIAIRFVELLLGQYNTDPEITFLVNNREIYVVPMHNPDGRKMAEAGILWRKNINGSDCSTEGYWSSNGVDLNRNFDWQWGTTGIEWNRCSEEYPGSGPASEPETIALQNYILSLFSQRPNDPATVPAPLTTQGMMFSLHSYGRDITLPWGYTYSQAPNYEQLSRIGQKLASKSGYNYTYPYFYLSSGASDDWPYAKTGIPSYTLEIGDDFFEPYSNIESLWNSLKPALLYSLNITDMPYVHVLGPELVAGWLNSNTITPDGPVSVSVQFPPDTTQMQLFLDTDDDTHVIASSTVTGGVGNTTLHWLEDIPLGRHIIAVRGKGDNGIWGARKGIGFISNSIFPTPTPTPILPNCTNFSINDSYFEDINNNGIKEFKKGLTSYPSVMVRTINTGLREIYFRKLPSGTWQKNLYSRSDDGDISLSPLLFAPETPSIYEIGANLFNTGCTPNTCSTGCNKICNISGQVYAVNDCNYSGIRPTSLNCNACPKIQYEVLKRCHVDLRDNQDPNFPYRVTLGGNGLRAGESVRLWLARADASPMNLTQFRGINVNTQATVVPKESIYQNHYFYQLAECLTTDQATCQTTIITLLPFLRSYYFYCDIPSQENGPCSGNPFCRYENSGNISDSLKVDCNQFYSCGSEDNRFLPQAVIPTRNPNPPSR